MTCPICNYAMSSFDKDCPRCHGVAPQSVAPKPAAPFVAPATPQTPPAFPVTAAKSGRDWGKWWRQEAIIWGVIFLIWFIAPGAIEGLGAAILGNQNNTPLFRWQQPSTPGAADLAKELKPGIDADQVKAGGQPFSELTLVESSRNNYDGYVETADGARLPIVVTRQDDGQTIWRIGN